MKKIESIFIIDDDPITVFGIKKLLAVCNIGVQIHSFGNGKEALECLSNKITRNETPPDVVFLDINMPIMDGWQFLEEFVKLPVTKRIRINIITSSIDPYDLKNWEYYKAKTHHLIDYRNKPIDKIEIEAITKAA